MAAQVEPLVIRLLTPEETAQLLGRHPKTVLGLASRGELRAIRLGARTVRFDPADVQAYIDAHRTAEPEPEAAVP